MQSEDIIKLAQGIRKNWKTNDPFEIAEKF